MLLRSPVELLRELELQLRDELVAAADELGRHLAVVGGLLDMCEMLLEGLRVDDLAAHEASLLLLHLFALLELLLLLVGEGV